MDQADVFAKYLKLVLVFRFFYKYEPQASSNNVLRTYVDSKVKTLSLESGINIQF